MYDGNYNWAREKHNESITKEKPVVKKQPTKIIPIEEQIEQIEKRIVVLKEQYRKSNHPSTKTELEKLELDLDKLLAIWVNE